MTPELKPGVLSTTDGKVIYIWYTDEGQWYEVRPNAVDIRIFKRSWESENGKPFPGAESFQHKPT